MTEREMFGYRWRYEDDKLYRLGKNPKQWTCCNGLKPGNRGYIQLWVNGKLMLIHRLVYYLHHPEWDITDTSRDNSIDHINGDKMNNKISNLRVVNNRQNQQNKTHYDGKEIRGVHFRREGRKKPWHAFWQEDEKTRSKSFETEEEALAYRSDMVRIHYTHAPIEMIE